MAILRRLSALLTLAPCSSGSGRVIPGNLRGQMAAFLSKTFDLPLYGP